MTMDPILRAATAADAAAIHHLISENVASGHLLPRTLSDVAEHAARFVVADCGGEVVACAELAPLSAGVAEVRSLVVAAARRGRGTGPRLVREMAAAASARGFDALCAFAHDPAPFVRLGFSLVPHTWLPEKIARDCAPCPLFRRCGRYAVTLALRAAAAVRPDPPSAVLHGRAAMSRRLSVEGLHLGAAPRAAAPEAVPA